MPLSTLRRLAIAFGGVLLLVVGLSVGTAAAVGLPGGPIDPADMQVTVAYGQATYKTDDTFTVTLTVTNNSDTDAENLRAFPALSQCVSGAFGFPCGFDAGVTIPAHSSLGAQLTGGNPLITGLAGTANCSVFVNASNMMGSVTGTGTATVTQAFGDFHGVLYADHNHDGTFEPGEGVDGITVTYFRDQDPFLTPTTITSGPDGQFVLTQVPTGAYGFEFSSRSGWVFGSLEGSASLTATVTEAGETAAVLLTRPLSDQLHAAIRFDQASYQPGDTVHVTVTLSNSGTTPISGVIADCNRVGDENSLQPGAGWARWTSTGPVPPSRPGGPGSSMPPSRCRTPRSCGVTCRPSASSGRSRTRTRARDTPAYADVPGDNAPQLIQIVQNDDSPVTNVHVQILNFRTHQVVATGVTDGNGEFALPNLAANQYLVHVSGPWFFKAPSSNYLQAISPGSLDQPRTFTVAPQG